jgi:hypothetical protein
MVLPYLVQREGAKAEETVRVITMKCISCEAEIGPQCPEDEERGFPICLPCTEAAKEEEMGDFEDTDTSEYDEFYQQEW